MQLKFVVTRSTKIASPLRIRRAPDQVDIGDKLQDDQEVVQIFCHEPKKLSRYLPGNPTSERGNKELAMFAAMMDFSNAMTPGARTELERLLTSAFQAGLEFRS